MNSRAGLVVVMSLLLAGCFFRASPEERCAKPQEYQSSQTIGDLRVPADLDTPDQQESMQIPEAGKDGYPDGRPCLEMPPDYFGRPVD